MLASLAPPSDMTWRASLAVRCVLHRLHRSPFFHFGTLRALALRRSATVAKLTNAKKKAEPSKDFGLPEKRKYPMPDASHARNAKARASQMEHQGKLSAADKKKIDAKADRILKKKG